MNIVQTDVSKQFYFLDSSLSLQKKINNLKELNILQFSNDDLRGIFLRIQDSLLKREFVSVVGRKRDINYKYFLLSTLEDTDPKVVMQGIRALLCFKDIEINKRVKQLSTHPNEMVREYIDVAFNKDKVYERKNVKDSIKKIKNIVVQGNTLDIMKAVSDNSVHLTFTSPPYYNARDYSIYQSYNEYLDFLFQVFKEIHRITQEGRFFIINTSPILIPRAGRQFSSKRYPIPFDIHRHIIDAGFEFIDDIIWVKPETSVKNRNGGFQQHRKPLAYKPNTVNEYIMVYRKKTSKLIDWNIKQYPNNVVNQSKVLGDFETSNLWRIDPRSDKTHSAIFPDELCRRIISFYSYVEDIVFDPFAGSGTFGKVALENKRNCFLTEISEEYCSRIKEKINGLFTNDIRYIKYDDFLNL